MNRFLIKTLEVSNILVALFIIIKAIHWGYIFPADGGGHILMIVLGLLGGIILAALVCGLVAIVIELEKHLRKLVSLREKQSTPYT